MNYIAAILVAILLGFLADPFMLYMPSMAEMLLVLAAAVLAIIYAGFVAKENGGDERDAAHRAFAGRVAYLSGVGVLVLALIVQGAAHAIDPWIPAALAVMIIAKAGAHAWAGRNR